jgi:hypothetical protein
MHTEQLTQPVKPFEFYPKPITLTPARIAVAQAVGFLLTLVGSPLLFVVTMWAPLTLSVRQGPLTAWVMGAYFAALLFAGGAILGLAHLMLVGRWVRRRLLWTLTSGLAGGLVLPGLLYLLGSLALPYVFRPGLISRMPGQLNLLGGYLVASAALGLAGGLIFGLVQAPLLKKARPAWRLATAVSWTVAAPLVFILVNTYLNVFIK